MDFEIKQILYLQNPSTMTIETTAPAVEDPAAAAAASAGVSRSSSEMSGSSESLNKDNSISEDSVGGDILGEISQNIIALNKISPGPMGAMGAKKKMSAPPKMLEEQTR